MMTAPTYNDILAYPTTTWAAILNSTTGLGPDEQPLFSRVTSAQGDTSTIKVVFAVHEPIRPSEKTAEHPIGTSGLRISWSRAGHVIEAAERSIREGADDDIARTIARSKIVSPDFRKTADVAAAFPTNTELVAALKAFRVSKSREALAATFTVEGVPLSLTQVLHVNDGLWNPAAGTADVEQLLGEAGVGPVSVSDPAVFVAAVRSAAEEALTYLYPMNWGSLQYSDQGVKLFMGAQRRLPANDLASLMVQQVAKWGVETNTIEALTTETVFTEQNYMLALSGFDLDLEHYPSKKYVLASLLRTVKNVAVTQAERDEVQRLIVQMNTAHDNSDQLPTLHDIASLGMEEARTSGGKQWLGRRGLIAHKQPLRLRLKLSAS